ncbi:ATP-binding protein [Streptomyces sp. MS06]|uniref:ATP-binding protein n=1 Tax=Streptomyces sp. MS06 TaxID=3385974 RepID=UPI0039A26F21
MRDDQRRDGSRAVGNLPAEPDAFVGRGAELAALASALDTARLVTVTGPGGVGKSRLAARAAAGRTPADGVWRVELAALRDPELVGHAVVEALGLTDHTARGPRETLLDRLAGRELLLVLDGFEHLADAGGDLVAALLGRLPGLRVLAVGRRPLRLAGERLLPLGPLGEDEAVELLADRACGHGVTVVDDPDVRRLCRRLDGIPLAVELAAGRLRALSPRQLLDRFADRFGLLSGGVRDVLPRHRALRTTIGWSHELCAPRERLLWARLSVFARRFELEAVEYVCGGYGLPADEILDVLTELIAQSVVMREQTAAGVRYRMLDAVRAYGRDWLEATGDAGRLRRRHRDWYVGLATWCELDWFSPRQVQVAARMEAELPNLRAALELCLTQDPDEARLGQYLAGTLWFCWVGCGRLSEGRRWLERCLESGAGPRTGEQPRLRALPRLKALWVLGYVAVLQGDRGPALAALHECRQEAERVADPLAVAYAEHRTGCLALVCDDMAGAEALLGSALARYEEIGELNSNVLMGRVELAMAQAFRGDLHGAVRLCEDVRRVCEDHGERWARAYALFVLAYAAWAGGDPGGARTLLAECLSGAHGFDDLLGSVLSVELLALVTAAEGDPEEAAVLQGAAARMWPSVGLPLFGSVHFGAPHRLCEATARERLGDERYEECVRRGGELTRAQAVARALGRGGPGVPGPRGRGRAGRSGAGTPGTPQPAASPARGGGEAAG